MDETFLKLVSLLVNLSNQVAALQAENAALKAQIPPPEQKDAPALEVVG